MEALIMSCSTGGGHNAAGYAVKEELESRGHRVTFLDPYELIGDHMAEKVGNSYIRLVQKSPYMFGRVYALGEAYRHLPIHSPVYWANGKAAFYMQQYLEKNHFDVIFMSHMYPAHILTNLRGKMELPPTFLIATDYTCIPFMEEAVCDYYVIPSEELTDEFAARGIPKDRILPLGIPIRRQFTAADNVMELREALQWSHGKRYILLAGGSIGAGEIEKAAQLLEQYVRVHQDYSIIIICGNNQKLFLSLTDRYREKEQMVVLRSTNHMADYMKACDLFITKAGGLSSTEAAAVEIPLIHLSPIPGCETRNAEFFQKRGMSMYIGNLQKELLPALERLEEDSAYKEQMKTAQRLYVNKQAARDICVFAENCLAKKK